jgi:hypothetical protein
VAELLLLLGESPDFEFIFRGDPFDFFFLELQFIGGGRLLLLEILLQVFVIRL